MRLLCVLFFCSLVSVSFECSCSETSNKELYCKADWVGIFKITEKRAREDEIEYKAGIVKMFKTTKNASLTNGVRVTLKTLADSGVCGIDWLQPKRLYLLSGKMDGRMLIISLCSQLYLEEWKKVPKLVKRQLKDQRYEPCENEAPK